MHIVVTAVVSLAIGFGLGKANLAKVKAAIAALRAK